MQPKPSLAHFDNDASRAMERYLAARDADDAAAVRALVSPAFEAVDRHRNVRAGIDTPVGTVSFLEPSASQPVVPLVATRGSRLALVRTRDRRPGKDGECLLVGELDPEGALAAIVAFDLGDFDLAMAELDVRFTSGEAKPHALVWNTLRRARQAIRRQDWDTLVDLTVVGAPIHDHRPLRARPVYVVHDSIEDFRAIYAMSPEAKVLVRHVVGICSRGCLMVGEWRGLLDEGVFELFTATVVELDAAGRIIRTDHHDLDQVEDARARYAELLG